MARRKFIAGNWKMNLGPQAADRLAMELKSALAGQERIDVAVAPTAVCIPGVAARLKHTGICVATQNLHPELSGAYTGEISAEMFREAGCTYAIIGHSERRTQFAEGDELVANKVKASFRGGLLPILCVGETLDERRSGAVESVLERQLRVALTDVPADQAAAITLAYEPVWAIGTGQNATPEQAQEAHAFIRGWLRSRFPAFVAEQVRIQYGGSVKSSNAAQLLSQPDVDGALIGGASLKAEEFLRIIEAAG